MESVYIGDLIKEKLKERGLPKAEFARRIHCSRGTVYNIFNRKSIDTDLLKTISDVLGYNFITDISDDCSKT